MRNAEVTRHARKRLGCIESPPRSNDGACVNAIQSSTGAYNKAWCASFVFKAWQDAGIDLDGWATASTYYLVDGGRSRGWLTTEPVEGSAVVWNPGASGHTELFIRWVDKSRRVARTIGGNTGDAVREHDRSVAGAYFVTPPVLLKADKVTVYWWEDPKAKPERHGLYDRVSYQERAIERWVAKHGNPGHVRRGKLSVRVNGKLVPRYTFWTGPRRRSADFTTKAARDLDLNRVAAARGRKLVPRSKTIPA